jgi:hypothetical protein
MEYYENGGGAVARLAWSSPSQAAQIIPAERFSSSDPRDNDGDGTSNSLDPDDDNDGIPDLQDADQDGDGVSSAAELAAGTDPQDSSSNPGSGVLSGEDGRGRCGATGAEGLIILGLLGIFFRGRREA